MLPEIEREIGEQLGGAKARALRIELEPEIGGDLAARGDQHELGAGDIEEFRNERREAAACKPRTQLGRIGRLATRRSPRIGPRRSLGVANGDDVARCRLDPQIVLYLAGAP